MKTLALVLASLLCALLLLPVLVDARVAVRGYVRRDGTVVAPHYRSHPDSRRDNNYSYPGNRNPFTGTIAPGRRLSAYRADVCGTATPEQTPCPAEPGSSQTAQ